MALSGCIAVIVFTSIFRPVICQDELVLEFQIAVRLIESGLEFNVLDEGEDNSMNESTTEMPPLLETDELKIYLNDSYLNTTAYLYIGDLSESANFAEPISYEYTVVYNLTYLDKESCGSSGNCFEYLSEEAEDVQQYIKKSEDPIGDNFEVDRNGTTAKTASAILSEMKDQLETIPCTPPCSVNQTCYRDGELSVRYCRDICEWFLDDHPECESENVLISGAECRIEVGANEPNTPYCYCGESLLLPNIYIYDTCQNMSFIVGMSAGILALILLALFITIGCLTHSKNSYQKDAEELRKLMDEEEEESGLSGVENPAYGKSWQNPADARQHKGITSPEDVRLEPMDSHTQSPYTATYDMPEERRDYTRVQNNLNKQNGYGHANQSYSPEPGAPWDSSSAEISETDAYRNFQPSITHIDPKKDYNIKRPNITVRPMDNLYNMENDKDFPMQSFHI